jgi:hypothetical protein
MARALAASSLVPKDFQNNIANCIIALEIASRIGCSAFAAMQNLAIVHGRPSWSSTFLIATVNASGKFTPLRFRWQGKEGADDWGCRAYAKDRDTGEECVGSLITMKMAKAEGWATRNGSKYLTMPEQMLAYRAAAFWTRLYSPELSLGIQTREEVIDTVGYEVPDAPAALVPGDVKALKEALIAADNAAPPPTAAHDADGVVQEPAVAKRGAKAKAAPEPKPTPTAEDGLPADEPDEMGGRM